MNLRSEHSTSVKSKMINVPCSVRRILPRALIYSMDPLTQFGSSPCICHYPLPDCLRGFGHVIACLCCLCSPGQRERSILHLASLRRDVHLLDGLPAAKPTQTHSRQVRKTPTTHVVRACDCVCSDIS